MTKPLSHKTRRHLRDSFAKDMADGQRARGAMPTTAENEAFLSTELERLEQKRAARKPARHVKDVPIERETDKMAAKIADDQKGVRVAISRDDDALAKKERPRWSAPSPFAQAFTEHLQRRVNLLLTKPDWRSRVFRAMDSYLVNRQKGLLELLELAELSRASFGDWKADIAKPIYFT